MVLRMEQQPNKIQPMLLSALAQLSACLIVWNFHIPNPNIVLFVVLSAVLVKCGYAAGIVSGLIAFLYSAFFFSTDHSFFLYTSLNLQKLIVIGLGIAANILLIGHLQRQFECSNMEKMQAETEEKLQETAESYRAKLYHDVLTGTYNRRYYEDIASRIVGPAGIALIDVDDFRSATTPMDITPEIWHWKQRQMPSAPASGSRTCSSAMAETNFCWSYPAFREMFCRPNWNRSARLHRWHPYPAIRISASH